MKVKTYGIAGLTEWYGKLRAGSIETAVSFVGGTVSPSGAQPAYYMTKDPIVQFVIENSSEFKSGFIKLVMEQEIPGEHRRMAMPKTATAPAVEPELRAEPASDAPVRPTADASGTTASTMSFANIEDAKDYFSEKYDVNRSKMRSRAAVEEVAKGYGITISWND